MLGRPERVPAMSFLDLTGYTHLSEQQGDATAAALAETLAVLVNRSSRAHGGVPVKWLGDGVMIHHREPAGPWSLPVTIHLPIGRANLGTIGKDASALTSLAGPRAARCGPQAGRCGPDWAPTSSSTLTAP